MKKTTIRIEFDGSTKGRQVIILGRFWCWLFYKLYDVEWAVSPLADNVHGKSSGHIVKAKNKAKYAFGGHNTGGRIVRTMPKSLKKYKESQESADE